ncbi:MAG: hypothetical protein FWE54_03760 [Methanimicrococcus sp.]|nr:hypothetical protein [Methanimicrococcus sp.]
MSFYNISKKSILRRVIMISAICVIISILTAGAVYGEIQISDSVSPMKIEISAASDSDAGGMISKTVSLRNTGDVPVHYIIYMDSARNENAASVFDLSATTASVNPGERFEFQISASKNEIEKYTEAELEDIKLKIIRNPDTLTPLGYIIPVTVRAPGEPDAGAGTGPDTGTGTGPDSGAGEAGSGAGMGAGAGTGAGTDTGTNSGLFETGAGNPGARENSGAGENSTVTGGNNEANNNGGEQSGGKTGGLAGSLKYKMILAAFAIGFILLSLGGLYVARSEKYE